MWCYAMAVNATRLDAVKYSLYWESKPNRYEGDITYGRIESDMGPLFAAETATGLCQLDFILGDNTETPLQLLQKNWPLAHCYPRQLKQLPASTNLKTLVGTHTQPTVALHLAASPFQQKVWQVLLTMVTGQVTTYSDIARQLQQPKAARAVGQAVAANPLALIVPCHRVINADATAGNYHWGSALKQRLLEAERALL